jgi:glycopeptide antibiotics resistance protein
LKNGFIRFTNLTVAIFVHTYYSLILIFLPFGFYLKTIKNEKLALNGGELIGFSPGIFCSRFGNIL